MFAVNVLKRVPKPLVGLAVLAMMLVMGAGAVAKPASAAPNTPYTVEVTWDRVRWSAIDDGFLDSDAEVAGRLSARNIASSDIQTRVLGDQSGNPCESDWSGSGPCRKEVVAGQSYFFSQTPMSASGLSGQHPSAYSFFNNKVRVRLFPGSTLALHASFTDYDALGPMDKVCVAFANMTFTEAQLQTLNFTKTMNSIPGNSPDGTCEVVATIRRV